MRHWIAAFTAILALTACDVEPEVSLEVPDISREESATTITPSQLSGTWRVEALTTSDCPSEWQRTMPTGETDWTSIDDHLVISASMGDTPPAELWPAGDNMLTRTIEVSFFGCTATEAIALIITTYHGDVAEGTYRVELTHDGSDACQEMSREAGLPERCETEMTWNARRLSGP